MRLILAFRRALTRSDDRRGRGLRGFLLVGLLSFAVPLALAEEGLEISVEGVSGRLAENVRASVPGTWASVSRLGSSQARNRFLADAEAEATVALRPFGFYDGQVSARLEALDPERWRLVLEVTPGAPVRIGEVDVRVTGPGANHESLAAWVRQWPLTSGTVLDQVIWQAQKQEVLDRANEFGFFLARFTRHVIALDLERNVADLGLVLESGPRAVMGEVRFEQDFLHDHVLGPVPRFESGEPYEARLLDEFRTDLWKLGYFSEIDVVEERDLDSDPPVVDLRVAVERNHRNTHQGTLGWGTDTEFRTQYRWQRHQLSRRGDNLTAGLGWQSRNEELLLYGEYRLPRRSDDPEYWLVNPSYQERDQRFELDVEGRQESIPVADGRVENLYVRAGRLKFRSMESSPGQLIETVYLEYLLDENRVDQLSANLVVRNEELPEFLAPERNRVLSLGVEWDWPNFTGQGFRLRGHRERAWLLTANEAWGSDLDFTQAYLSSRWNLPLGDRWRLLLRAELGSTDADVRELELQQDDETFFVSLTRLPFRYRFLAGGSHSVRGYGYESLSNNGVGSNHILTASVELEHRLQENWSVAAFADVGNAFNDWGNPRLRKGVGLGVRWYRFGFPVRLDVAQARDLDGEPWRIHFTIGSPLF